jgi:hypothetical protein
LFVCRLDNSEVRQLSERCEGCVHYLSCTKHLKDKFGSYVLRVPRDSVINDFGGGRLEVVIYGKKFQWLEDYENYQLDLKKNFMPYDCPTYGRVLIPFREEARLQHMLDTLADSSFRARDNFYGYALSNCWKYFYTFTFDPKKVDRYDDSQIMWLWQMFRQKLQRWDRDVKILCVRERHEDGALHFHGLIDTQKDFLLKPYYDDRAANFTVSNGKKWALSKFGDPLFTFDLWDYGINTLVVLPKDAEENQTRVANYMIGYVTKQGGTGYGKKRFFRTQNLNFKEQHVTNRADAESLIVEAGLKLYKTTDKLTVYRNFNIKGNNDGNGNP